VVAISSLPLVVAVAVISALISRLLHRYTSLPSLDAAGLQKLGRRGRHPRHHAPRRSLSRGADRRDVGARR
jgi:hypothetical protein